MLCARPSKPVACGGQISGGPTLSRYFFSSLRFLAQRALASSESFFLAARLIVGLVPLTCPAALWSAQAHDGKRLYRRPRHEVPQPMKLSSVTALLMLHSFVNPARLGLYCACVGCAEEGTEMAQNMVG